MQNPYNTTDIYGREKEEKTLQYYIDSKPHSSNRIVSIDGVSGIGKSVLVSKIVEKNRDKFSHICQFKLDFSQEITPYQILYNALSNMLKQILSGDEAYVAYYKLRLQTILGGHGYILAEVIPEIRILLGEESGNKDKINHDSSIQIDNLLIQFMEIFSDASKPLCIYVDDLQWADSVTLQWLKNVALRMENVIFFLLHRKEEVEMSDNVDLLTAFLDDLASHDLIIDNMQLSLLKEEDIHTLIGHSIFLERSQEIAHILYERTKGNPFFVKQYLNQLHAEGALYFDPLELTWKCDMEKINALQLSDNVFELMARNMDLLPLPVRDLLSVASCVGNTFSSSVLKRCFHGDTTFDETLKSALSSGWIVENTHEGEDKNYRFLHDKMQETIHNSLEEAKSLEIHYTIGCYLEKKRVVSEPKELLNCVNHLNIAQHHVKDKTLLGNLNQEASLYAKRNSDFENALTYITYAMALLFEITSDDNSVLLLKERAECEHLCHHNDEAISYCKKALDLSTNKLQKGEIYELLIKLYSNISKYQKAYEIGRMATRYFGVKMPKSCVPPLFIAEFIYLKIKLRAYDTEALMNLPQSEDEHFKMTIRLLANTLQAAYQIDPKLCVENAMIIVKLCLEHGLTKESVIGFTVFGVIFQGGILGNKKLGFEYSQFSFNMLERFHNTTQHAEVKFVCGYFGTSWRQAAEETEAEWKIAYKNGLEIGDWFHTGCAAAGIVQSMFMRGVVLEDIMKQILYFEKTLQEIGSREQYGAMMSVKQTLLNFRGETASFDSYNSKNFDEADYVKRLEQYESEHFAHYYYINKMISLYVHKAYKEANLIRLEGLKYAKSSQGMLHHTEYLFYEALILAQLIGDANLMLKLKYKKMISGTKNKFMKWAKGCSENFLVRANILQAEVLRIEKNPMQAFLFYDKAIELANVYGQKHLFAISSRLAGELYDSLGQKKAATVYYNDAMKSFHDWGMNTATSLDYEHSIDFDVNTLIKVSEVIAKEDEFATLLKTLIDIIVENVGAEHGVLLLEKNGDLRIQAFSSGITHETKVMQDISYLESDLTVHSIIHYVLRSKESMVIDEMAQNNIFDQSNVSSRLVKSVLCAPLVLQGELKGIIYLENNLLTGAFTQDKVNLLQHLSAQIIISIENVMVYNKLEEKVKQRTKDLEKRQVKLKHLASIDPMTKLFNRRYFTEVSDKMFQVAKRERSNLSLIMIDIDDFKNINDSYGHPVGDKVIISIASILKEQTRVSDIVCRFGGEEYIVLLPHTDIQSTQKVAEMIRKRIEDSSVVLDSNDILNVTASLGVSMVNTEDDQGMEVAIKRADNALYEAKKGGKNRVVLYSGR